MVVKFGEPDDEERRPHQRVQHPVQGEALVVGVDDRIEVGVEVHPGELEGLERPEQAANQQGRDGNDQVVADELTFLGGELPSRPHPRWRVLRCPRFRLVEHGHGVVSWPAGTALTVPNIVA
jgi:hypothetical protein